MSAYPKPLCPNKPSTIYQSIPNDEIVSKDVIIKYNKEVTPQNAIRVTGPPLTVAKFKQLIDEEEKRRNPNPPLTAEALSDFNTLKKGKKSATSGSLSPKLAIQGMISHNNPKSSSKNNFFLNFIIYYIYI